MSKYLRVKGRLNKLLDQHLIARRTAKKKDGKSAHLKAANTQAYRTPQYHAAAYFLQHWIVPELLKDKQHSIKVIRLDRWIKNDKKGLKKQFALIEAMRHITDAGLYGALSPANILMPAQDIKKVPDYDDKWKSHFPDVLFPKVDKHGKLKDEIIPLGRYRTLTCATPEKEKTKGIVVSCVDLVKMRQLAYKNSDRETE